MENKTLFMSYRYKLDQQSKTVLVSGDANQVSTVGIGNARVIEATGDMWNDWFDGDDVSVDFIAARQQP